MDIIFISKIKKHSLLNGVFYLVTMALLTVVCIAKDNAVGIKLNQNIKRQLYFLCLTLGR